jgi:hypothetical protein
MVLVAAVRLSAALGQRSAGILYEVWHTHAAQAMANVSAQGGVQLTVETVIRCVIWRAI